MLRLASSCPPLWRTPSSVQLGTSATSATVRVDDIVPWQESLLAALHDGIPEAMVVPLARYGGAGRAEAEEFLAHLAPALRVRTHRAHTVRVELPAELSAAEETAIVAGLRAAEVEVAGVTRWEVDDADPNLAVVVVAYRLADPRRLARLTATDTPHLIWEVAGDAVTVGPLVLPGRTGCAACHHAHLREADPQWPLLACQLVASTAFRTAPVLLWESALMAGRLLNTTGEDGVSMSVTVSGESDRRVWRSHRPHPQCLCRSPAGNASVAADGLRSEPTTATALARPA